MYTKPLSKRQRKILSALALSRRILLMVLSSTKEFLDSDTPFLRYSHSPPLSPYMRDLMKKAGARRTLRDLERRKFLTIRKQGNDISYKLSNKGRRAAIKDLIRMTEDYPDQKICIVSFDIPEQERSLREQIRYMLKDFSFSQEQKSLWTSRRAIAPLLTWLIEQLNATRWVKVYEAERSGSIELE